MEIEGRGLRPSGAAARKPEPGALKRIGVFVLATLIGFAVGTATNALIGLLVFFAAWGVLLKAIGYRSPSARNKNHMAEAPPGTVWVKEYKDPKRFQQDADLMVANSWEVRQQSQGSTHLNIGRTLAVGDIGRRYGLASWSKGKILITWVRTETKSRCRFCAEDIRLGAVVCPHCGREQPGVTIEGQVVPSEALPMPADGLAPVTPQRGERLRLDRPTQLRPGPTVTGLPSATIAAGSEATVLASENGWVFVQDDDGVEGWTQLN